MNLPGLGLIALHPPLAEVPADAPTQPQRKILIPKSRRRDGADSLSQQEQQPSTLTETEIATETETETAPPVPTAPESETEIETDTEGVEPDSGQETEGHSGGSRPVRKALGWMFGVV